MKVRVTSVENGRKFQNSKRSEATMPDGPAIFETSGAWEDFSTPSRDLRFLEFFQNSEDRVTVRWNQARIEYLLVIGDQTSFIETHKPQIMEMGNQELSWQKVYEMCTSLWDK